MKYILLMFIVFSINAQESVPVSCWYSQQGHFCGDYKDDDPYVIANGECKLSEKDFKKVISRDHIKLKQDGKVECPPVIDEARKAEAEAEVAEQEQKELAKEAAKEALKAKDKTKLTDTEKLILEALGL